MEVYFDNAASTKPLDSVIDCMVKSMKEEYANPASMSILGLEGEKKIIQAKKTIAEKIGTDFQEIYFTSGGTEGNNWAIRGVAEAYSRSGKHIVTTKIEHPAILEPMRYLEKKGFQITYLNVNREGMIYLEQLQEAIKKDTILVSIMTVNNETGAIQPMEEIGKCIKEKNPQTLFHTDAVQAAGKMEITAKKWRLDMMTASGHKFHAPKGMGFLYLKKELKVLPFLLGGGQQNGMRSGTENPAGAAALALAFSESMKNWQSSWEKTFAVKKEFFNQIQEQIPNVMINGSLKQDSPYILNLSFSGVRSEVLLHALEEKGIYVSSGSACSSRKKKVSSVLEAMGLKPEEIQGSIRFSFSRFSTIEEAEYCTAVLKQVIPVLRKYHR